MQPCWTLFISTLLLVAGFGLYSISLIGEFTAVIMPIVYIVTTVILPALIVGALWLEHAGQRIRHWRIWNYFARNVSVELDPALTDVNVRIDSNVAYAYLVEYEKSSWESDIPVEALFTFALPGTRNLALRELPTIFAPTSLLTEPILGWLLPYVGVQTAPYPLALGNAFKNLPGRDVALFHPSDPDMPLDGFVKYDAYFFETLHHLEYHVVPVRIKTTRRLEHTYGWYAPFVPAFACLFGVAPASLPLLLWSWWRSPSHSRTRICMGAPVNARDFTYEEMRSRLDAVGEAKEKVG